MSDFIEWPFTPVGVGGYISLAHSFFTSPLSSHPAFFSALSPFVSLKFSLLPWVVRSVCSPFLFSSFFLCFLISLFPLEFLSRQFFFFSISAPTSRNGWLCYVFRFQFVTQRAVSHHVMEIFRFGSWPSGSSDVCFIRRSRSGSFF